jgi:hypothetical protein
MLTNADYTAPARCDNATTTGERVGHVRWLLDQIDRLSANQQVNIALLGLGFAQGVLWSARFITIEQIRIANWIPDGEQAQFLQRRWYPRPGNPLGLNPSKGFTVMELADRFIESVDRWFVDPGNNLFNRRRAVVTAILENMYSGHEPHFDEPILYAVTKFREEFLSCLVEDLEPPKSPPPTSPTGGSG